MWQISPPNKALPQVNQRPQVQKPRVTQEFLVIQVYQDGLAILENLASAVTAEPAVIQDTLE